MVGVKGFKQFFLEILNSKLVIITLTFTIAILAFAFAGNVVVQNGALSIDGESNFSGGIVSNANIEFRHSGESGWVNQVKWTNSSEGLAHLLYLDRTNSSRLGLRINYGNSGSSNDFYISGGNVIISSGNLTLQSGNGKIGIGTSNPNQTLDVNGNVQALSYITVSDRTLKNNIQELNVDSVFSITPKLYSYQFKKIVPIYNEQTGEFVRYDEELLPVQVGLMQDEVPDLCKRGNGIDNYCLLSLSYTKIAKQQEEIIKQQEEIDLLKKNLCKKDNSYEWCA